MRTKAQTLVRNKVQTLVPVIAGSVVPEVDNLLLETGDDFLLEAGGYILLEGGTPPLVTSGLAMYYDYANPACYTPNIFNNIFDLTTNNCLANGANISSQFYLDSSDYTGSFVFNPTNDPGNPESFINLSNVNSSGIPTPYNAANPTITFDFWLKIVDKAGGGHTIFGSAASATSAGRITIQAIRTSSTGGYFRVNKGAFGINTAVFSGYYTWPFNTPLNLTITKTGFVYELYVNGEFKASVTDGSSTTYNSGGHALGQNWNPGAPTGQKAVEKFTGSMYTFMAYNRVLTSAEIAQNFAFRRARFGL